MANRQCAAMDAAVKLYLTADPKIGIRTAAKRAGVSPSGLGYALGREREKLRVAQEMGTTMMDHFKRRIGK